VRGQIDRDVGKGGFIVIARPAARGAHGAVQREGAELQDELAVLGQRNERGRRDQTALGMSQRISASNPTTSAVVRLTIGW